MRRLPIAVAAASVLSLGVAAGAFALQSTPQVGMGEPTLVVIENAVSDTVVDLGPEGDSLGDTLAFSNPLSDEAEANLVGHSQGTCTRVEVGVAWECTWTNVLENGSLVVQGPFLDAGESMLAITGGTGDYAGATGQMRLHALEGGTKYEFAFDVR
jgi:hypothetical protein